MAQLLGQVAVGSIVKINENGSPTNYIVVNQGIPGNSPLYDASCNGTWLLRQDIYGDATWSLVSNNDYSESNVGRYLNNNFPLRFDANIQEKIIQAKIPYCVWNGSPIVNSGSNGFQVKCFLLSYTEIGFSGAPFAAAEGSALEYFNGAGNGHRIAYYNGNTKEYWTRSPYTSPSFSNVWCVLTDGSSVSLSSTYNSGGRPAVIFPQSMVVLDDGTLSTSIPSPTLTVPSQAMQGQPIPINRTASTNADSYQLQRKVDSGEWTTIYTGPNLTFTDTAGSWSTVQYQVAAGLGGEYGEYATSAVIPVISASALVISGSDEDLGTITADIPYTVTSDTGNQITHTLTVNGVQFATATEASGVAHSIPVMELPTGTGTIVITASVQATSGPVTATRTWTYTKAPISFPDAAGVGVLQKNGQNFLPATLAELVRTNPFWGGTLDKALEMMTGVALNGAQIEVGSYKGTGTYGGGNPNSLTFGFYVLFLVVMKRNGSSSQMPNQSSYANRVSGQFYAIRNAELLGCTAQNPGNSGSTAPFIQFSWGDNSVTWFAPNSNYPEDQFNGVGQTYDYLAFGKKE